MVGGVRAKGNEPGLMQSAQVFRSHQGLAATLVSDSVPFVVAADETGGYKDRRGYRCLLEYRIGDIEEIKKRVVEGDDDGSRVPPAIFEVAGDLLEREHGIALTDKANLTGERFWADRIWVERRAYRVIGDNAQRFLRSHIRL